jgi:serine/threonine protein kinase
MEAEFAHQKELNNLTTLSCLKHPNVVELLSSYTCGSKDTGFKHNLLFPLAEKGNLEELLAKPRENSDFSSQDVVLVELARLSSGIAHVHNFAATKIDLELIGCHHDLRPANILVDGSKLILADFGMSTFKATNMNSVTLFKVGVDDYLAPECEDPADKHRPGLIHRSSDIWSFGCIIANIAIYMAYDSNQVATFRKERRDKEGRFTTYAFHLGSRKESPVVFRWLSQLEDQEGVWPHLVFVIRHMLSMDQSKRPNADQVTLQLRHIALYAAARSVDVALCELLDKNNDSLDLFLEGLRFRAWRHATDLLYLRDTFIRRYQPGFEDTLSHLHCFSQAIYQNNEKERDHEPFGYSWLLELNDQLESLLDQKLRQSVRTYYNVTVLDSDRFANPDTEQYTAGLIDETIRMGMILKRAGTIEDPKEIEGDVQRLRLIQRDVLIGKDKISAHVFGTLQSNAPARDVLIEWRSYRRHGVDEAVIQKLHNRVAVLAHRLSQPKPASFRALTCQGFFHDSTKRAFGVVYELPQETVVKNSFHLLELLESTTRNIKQWPDLDDKFKLAISLSNTLLNLHMVGWLHKEMASYNICFFPKDNALSRHCIGEPYLIGFNFSRPDDPTTFTEGLSPSAIEQYQHPRYIKDRSGYRVDFDYYGLGIVLTEIGCWKPISEIMKKYEGSYEDRSKELLSKAVPDLSKYMGRDYVEAVRFCLQGPGLEQDKRLQDCPNPSLLFEEHVVHRLERSRF